MELQTKSIIQSVVISLSVSIILGIIIGLMASSISVGIGVFVIAMILQFVIGYFVSGLQIAKDNKNNELFEQVLKDLEDRKIPFDLSCAYCNTVNKVPVSFTQDNLFNCSACKQPSRVYLQFTTARLTVPLAGKVEKELIPMDAEDVAAIRQTTINSPVTIEK